MSTPDRATIQLTGGSLLARNIVINLAGQGVPLLAALIAIPLLIHGLGTDRFGVLTLAWMVIGYFSLFDLGLGRALTQLVAERLSTGNETLVPPLVWTALVVMFLLGLLGALVVGVISPWLVHSVLKIPEQLHVETLKAFYLLAAAIPVVTITAGFSGVLSALQRFGVLNAIRIPMGIYNFLAPLLILPFSKSLFLVTVILVIGRFLSCGAHLTACLHVMPALRSGFAPKYETIKPLFHFGAWMTVTNVIGPLMVYLDRFVIGAVVSVAAVAYYATPYEIITKLWIIPSSIAGVLFPAIAATYAQDHDRTMRLLAYGTKYVALLLFPGILVITVFAQEGLQWWLGNEFARNSTLVMQWLAVGVFFNSIAIVFFTLIQGIGRPDISAKVHILELLVYFPVLWWAIRKHGILGAAIAWTGRVAIDGFLFLWLSSRVFDGGVKLFKRISLGILVPLCGFFIPFLASGFVHKVVLTLLVMMVFVLASWFFVLAKDERIYVKDHIEKLFFGKMKSA